jgi:hypothetical protein
MFLQSTYRISLSKSREYLNVKMISELQRAGGLAARYEVPTLCVPQHLGMRGDTVHTPIILSSRRSRASDALEFVELSRYTENGITVVQRSRKARRNRRDFVISLLSKIASGHLRNPVEQGLNF